MSVIVVTLVILFGLKCCNSQSFVCCDGTVRLAGGSVSNEGRVEICQSGQWKTICDNNWSENEARVVCRQLGYTTQGAVPLIRAIFGIGTGMIVEQVRCNGTERQLADCTMRDVTDGECNHDEDAGVRCSCQNGDLRLQGSSTLGRGRVEVCLNNVWGTVCDNSWNTADANVACNQLGFSRFGALSYCCARDGQGTDPIHMTNVVCRGNELSLTDCSHTTNHTCTHSEDASVQCQTRINCHDGDVRLVDGSQPHEGRVEICFNETWGTICDSVSSSSQQEYAYHIICKQLGYSGAATSTFNFGRGSTPASIAYVYCSSETESSLAECTYRTQGSTISSCLTNNRYDIIGLRCKSDTLINGTLRLTDGLTQYEGRVEMYYNSEWRYVCSDEWDDLDAMVVCRQFGYLATSVQIKAISYEFKLKRSRMLVTSVGCSGLESNLTSGCCATECSHSDCHSATYAGVMCGQCNENSIKLIGELSQTEGVVVICLGGRWGKVCGSDFFYVPGIETAIVVCRQLGLSTNNPLIYYHDVFSRQIFGLPFMITNVQCTSNETQLYQCKFNTYQSRYCYAPFAMKCQLSSNNIPDAPQNIRVFSTSSYTVYLSWNPLLMSETLGLTIFGYIINCSTESNILENAVHYTDSLNATLSNLQPFTTYNCCVAADSNHGRGQPACQSTVTWDRTLYPYNAVPTRVKGLFLNSSSLLLSWHSPDALYTNVIHVIEEYHIEVIDSGAGDQHIYTTEDTYLLIDDLKPNRQYTFRVAAFAGERGQFSQPLTVNISKEMNVQSSSKSINSQQEIGSLTLSLASILGLVSLILMIAIIVVSIYISYRLCRSDKKAARPVEVPVYEMVDMPERSHHNDSSTKPENKLGDIDIKQLILKQEQAKDFSHLPHEYFMPPTTTFDQNAGPGRAVTDEENTYQPLIPPRFRAFSDDKSEYQSLTHKSSTLPAKFNISPLAMGPAPPAIPPKPKAM